MLDAIAQYWPVAVINGLAAIAFMIGYVLFGVAMTKTGSCLAGPAYSLLWALRPICWAWAFPSSFQRPHGRSPSWVV